MGVTEYDQISDQEIVLRKALIQTVSDGKTTKYYREDLSSPIQKEVFRPTQRDIDGISVFREHFTTALDLVTKLPGERRAPSEYLVLRIPVEAIRAMMLSVVPTPNEDTLPGHSEIPELNAQTRKRQRRALQQVLANWVNQHIDDGVLVTFE